MSRFEELTDANYDGTIMSALKKLGHETNCNHFGKQGKIGLGNLFIIIAR